MQDQAQADPFRLQRFVTAQDAHRTFEHALDEITRGAKTSHWMWFIFPQLGGLGKREMAATFGISGRDEAQAYLAHPVLGARLVQCAEAALGVTGRTAQQIFGTTDALKLRSSATLFASVSPPASVFHRLLSRYYDDVPDARTVSLLHPAR